MLCHAFGDAARLSTGNVEEPKKNLAPKREDNHEIIAESPGWRGRCAPEPPGRWDQRRPVAGPRKSDLQAPNAVRAPAKS